MKSSFGLRNITVRNTYYTGATVTAGPNVSTTYPLGTFKEDYQYNATSTLTPDYLDDHNGRFCVTPEYPNGIYCYFTTVNNNWNSSYPYVVGPTFYGTKVALKVTSITETVTTYTGSATGIAEADQDKFNVMVYPNPASDLVAIQLNNLNKENLAVELFDIKGALVQKTTIYQGSTIAYFDTRTLYSGEYIIRIYEGNEVLNKKVLIEK